MLLEKCFKVYFVLPSPLIFGRWVAKNNESIPVNHKRLIWILVFLVVLTWVSSIFIIPLFYKTPQEAGTFGDMFGAINSLFSGLAFVGVIVAILLQKSELELQRQELEETRGELKGQKIQLEEQNKTFKLQSFEGTFFQLLRLYNEIVSSTDIDTISYFSGLFRKTNNSITSQPPATGKDGFVKLYSILLEQVLEKMDQYVKTMPNLSIEEVIEEEYGLFFENYQSDLAHYYRTIYTIIKFVDNSDIIEKVFYTNILRAQLSSHELLLLNYNAKSVHGKDKMMPYLTKYNILKHMPKGEAIERQYLVRQVDKKQND